MNNHTALVTGATSGLGFEAAAKFAARGIDRVIITGRSKESAATAQHALEERTGAMVFETLVVDFNDPEQVEAAVTTLRGRGGKVSSLLLNAGMVAGSSRIHTDAGIEVTMSSSLIGHHIFTMGLLEADLLTPSASIVIAGSEAARGDVPTFKPTDLHSLAEDRFDGDLAAAGSAIITGSETVRYKSATAYADAKVFVARWAAQLAPRLPQGMTVNAVSPGSAPDTDAGRNAEGIMKYLLIPMFKLAPKRLGMSAPVSVAAQRYLDVLDRDDVTGEFFASAPGKMTGPVEVMDLPHVRDEAAQVATWDAVVAVSGGISYPTAA